MSGKQNKNHRRTIKKMKDAFFDSFIHELYKEKFTMRLKIAWALVLGKKKGKKR